MEFKKIYSGNLIRTTPTEPYFLIRREFSLYVVYNEISIDSVLNKFREETPLIKPKTISNNFIIAGVNSPIPGVAIIMNVSNEDKGNLDLARERLRSAFFRAIKVFSSDLGISFGSLEEDLYISTRTIEMYKDAADLLTYELTD